MEDWTRAALWASFKCQRNGTAVPAIYDSALNGIDRDLQCCLYLPPTRAMIEFGRHGCANEIPAFVILILNLQLPVNERRRTIRRFALTPGERAQSNGHPIHLLFFAFAWTSSSLVIGRAMDWPLDEKESRTDDI